MAWRMLLTLGCSFVDEVPCASDRDCEEAFGPGSTCDAGGCVLVEPPPGCDDLESGGFVVDEDVTDATEWLCDNAPYRVEGTLRVTGRLALGPGVVVEMAPDASIVVRGGGVLEAAGTDDRPVTFRPVGPVTAGAWTGLVVEETAGRVALTNTEVQGAGGAGGVGLDPDEQAAIVVFGAAAIVGTTITDSAGYGVRFARGGGPDAFAGNTLSGAALGPLRLDANDVDRLGEGNTFDDDAEIEVDATVVDHDATWRPLGAPLRLRGDGLDEGLLVGLLPDQPAMLTLTAGLELRFEPGTGLFVGQDAPGGLVSQGTPDAPVRLTAATTEPWDTVEFGPQTIEGGATLSHTLVEHAGRDEFAGILVVPSEATARFDALTVRDCADTGLVVDGFGATAEITSSRFEGNLGDGLSSGNLAATRVDGCLFADNGDEGVSVRFGGDPSTFTNCVFEGNAAGAMLVANDSLGNIGGGHSGGEDQVIAWDEQFETTVASDLVLFEVGLPYEARTPMTVQPGNTLFVKQGVEVRFVDDAALTISNGATFDVAGIPSDPVRLTGSNGESWPGLFVDPAAVILQPGGLVVERAEGGWQP